MSTRYATPGIMMSNTPKGATPSPDSLRLNRLDRLSEQLTEHNMSLRKQVSVATVVVSKRVKWI